MKKVKRKKIPRDKNPNDEGTAKKALTLDDTISSLSDETIPRRFRNPISQKWDDTTWL